MPEKPHLILMSIAGKTIEEQAQMALNLARRITGRAPTAEELAKLRATVEEARARCAAEMN